MRLILFLLPMLCFASPKIYDCFAFFNELDILEIRLKEMYDHVDYFVLVEALETFQGTPKPLYYAENKDRFRKYNDKIIHVVVEDQIVGEDMHWVRDYYQKDQLLRGLEKCKKDDLIIFSDVDEIIRGTDIKKMIKPILQGKCKVVTGSHRFYKYYLNRRLKEMPNWLGAIVTTYKNINSKTPRALRDSRDQYRRVDDIGWHFSSVGGLKMFKTKMASFAHPEENRPEVLDPMYLYHRVQRETELVPIDDSYPRFIREKQHQLMQKGYLDYDGNPVYK